LNVSEANEKTNNELKRTMIRMSNEIKEGMYKHPNDFKENANNN
jgi:hypothetical protein